MFLKYFTEGVFPAPGNAFQLVENATNGAIVKAGFAMLQGVTVILDEDQEITFDSATSQPRIDRVVLRHDDTLSVRNTSIQILKGTPSSKPQPPTITRNETIYDLALADVLIRANTSVVTQAQITDLRLNTDLCGIVKGTIEEIDTTSLYDQIQGDLENFQVQEQQEFMEWFETIKDKLSTDQAGSLQLQIDDLSNKVEINTEGIFNGYLELSGNTYSGVASNEGIEIAKASGNYKQEGTPTPGSPVEPKFFEPKNIASSGNNLYSLDNFVNLNENFTIDNDGWFVINHTNNTGGIEFFNIYHKPITELKKNSDYYYTIELEKNIFSGSPILYINSLEVNSSNSTQFENGNVTFNFNSDNKIVLLTTKENFDSSQYLLRTYLYIPNGSSIDFKFRITLSPIENANFETYKPIYTTPLSLILRALPNGVKDTYENRVITRRVGYIEFDGSNDEYWMLYATKDSTKKRFRTDTLTSLIKKAESAGTIVNLLSDRYKVNSADNTYDLNEGISVAINGSVIIYNEEYSTKTIDEWKQYLQSNPIKVWYQLATPTTEEVELPIIPSYYPYTNAWHDSEVEASELTWNILSAINGIVTNDWGTENLDKKAPSIQSVLDNLQPKQLLINPDFQVWQRGESISFNDTDTTTNGFKYFADMWCTYFTRGNGDSCTFEKVSNGIKITTSRDIAMSQFMSEALDSNKNYTFVASINGTVHTLTFKGQESKNSELLQYMNKADTSSYDRLIIHVKNNDVVNYVHLWEGNITYPHVKKSYQDDLWDCQAYVQKLGSRVVPLAKTWGENRNSVLIAYIALSREMISNPMVNVTWSSWVYSSNDTDGYDVASENCNFIYAVVNNELDIRITKKDGGIFNKNYDYFINTDDSGILLSCEPL